jgi:hypothetical protein
MAAIVVRSRVEESAGGNFPKPNDAVVSARKNGRSVGANGQGRDRRWVPQRLADELAGRQIPAAHHTISTTSQQKFPARAERHC